MTLIKADYKNRNINLTELAEKIGISRGTLDRLHKFESCSHETNKKLKKHYQDGK